MLWGQGVILFWWSGVLENMGLAEEMSDIVLMLN